MPTRAKTHDDFDSPWKDALDRFLQAFLGFFFPAIAADIDWTRGYVALDKEFQQIIRKAKPGRRLADKLFKVWHKDGQERWLLIHIEVQGAVERDFAERMFVYNVRAFQLYNRPVVSLAVLADDSPDWRPTLYEYGGWGCTVGIRFPTVKLLDYGKDSEVLEKSDNPFAAVVLAHLKALETRRDATTRRHWKLRLVKGLYERNWTAEDIRGLFRLIDWILELPDELQEQFRADVQHYEEEKRMPYLSSIERLALKEGLEKGRQEGREEGLRQGLLEGIGMNLETKFGQAGRKLLAKIRRVQDVDSLRALAQTIKGATTLNEVRRQLD